MADVSPAILHALVHFCYTATLPSPTPSFEGFRIHDLAQKYLGERASELVCQVVRDAAAAEPYVMLQGQLRSLFGTNECASCALCSPYNSLISSRYVDVRFLFASGETLSAHRCVLAARSAHFWAKFAGGFQDSQNAEFAVADYSYDVRVVAS